MYFPVFLIFWQLLLWKLVVPLSLGTLETWLKEHEGFYSRDVFFHLHDKASEFSQDASLSKRSVCICLRFTNCNLWIFHFFLRMLQRCMLTCILCAVYAHMPFTWIWVSKSWMFGFCVTYILSHSVTQHAVAKGLWVKLDFFFKELRNCIWLHRRHDLGAKGTRDTG